MEPATLVTQERIAFGREPIVLIGDPRRCQGSVHIHNPSDARIKLRRLRFRFTDKALGGGCEDAVAAVSAALCPGEAQLSRISLRLPPGTPPGEYRASLEGAQGAQVPVSIQVLESRRMRLAPAAITLGCRPGEVVRVRTSASNLGNVAIDLPKRALLELQPVERSWRSQFHAAARAHAGGAYAEFLDDFARRLHRDEPPAGRAKLLAGAGSLAPQDVRLLEIELCLPKRLRPRRRYQARVALAGAQLQLLLYVGAPAPTPSVPG